MSSPKEQAAGGQLDYLRTLQDSFSKPTFDLQSVLPQVLAGLRRSSAISTSAMSQNIGGQLSASGVAGGQPRSEAYISALAPMYANEATQESQATQQLTEFGAQNTLQQRQTMLGLTGQENSIIDMLKKSSSAGDWMGILQTIAKIGGSVAGIPGFMNLFKSTPATSGIDDGGN
jgi:hypothetical protein